MIFFSFQADFTELQEEDVTVPGLSHLFVMSRNFVNVVFRPFSDIEGKTE